MRGKTNATIGIHLNATAVNKTVKSGQIVAGDFVEYYTTPTVIEQSKQLDFKFTVNDYAIAASTDGILYAFKNGAAAFSYSDHNCVFVQKYNDWILFHDNALGVLGVLSITNNGFELISSISTGDTAQANRISLCGGNGKVLYAKFSSATTNIHIGVADISNSGILTSFQLSHLQFEGESPNQCYNTIFLFYNSDEGFMCFGSDYDSTYNPNSWRIWRSFISLDSGNNASFSGFTSSKGDNFSGCHEIYRNDEVVLLRYSSISSGASAYCSGYVHVINPVSCIFSTGGLPEWGEVLTYIEDGYFLGSAKTSSGSGSSMRVSVYAIKLFAFNEETYEYEVLDGIETSADKGISDLLGGYDNGIFYLRRYNYSPRDLNLYEVFNETQLQNLSQKNYVIPYAAGHPIGVAQTDGNVDDVIPVYIPTATP